VALVVFLLSLVLVGTTVGLVATRLFPGEVVAPLQAAFLLAFAEIVSLSFVLSLAGWLTRTGVVIGLVCVLALVTPFALRHKRAAFPWRPCLGLVRDGLREPPLAVLAAGVGLALLYALALGVATPANDWDSLIYHLPRATLWAQQGSIGYIRDATDLRLNAMPPNAEIVSLFTMLTSGGDRLVALGQFAALVAAGGSVYGIACRVGLERRQALFGAALFMSLPVLLLQAGTALNDVVVASLLLAATYFALGARRLEVLFAALALALAVGTKFTAILALPVLIVVVAAFQPVRRWGRLTLVTLLGIGGGSYWYVLNLVETGKLDAGVGAAFRQIPDRSLGGVLLRTYQLASDLLELPATIGRGRWTYLVVGLALLLAAAILFARHRRGLAFLLAPVGCEVAVTPLVFEHIAGASPEAVKPLLRLAGSPQLVGQAVAPIGRADSEPFAAGYGAVGVILLIGAVVLAARSAPSRRLGLALALAPALFVPIFAYAVIYDDIRSRFLAYPVGLSAAVWGLALPRRALSTSLVALAAVTCFTTLAFATYKPSGIELLAKKPGAWSVWSASPRRVVEATTATLNSDDVSRYVDRQIPRDAPIGLAVSPNTALYPYVDFPSRPTRLLAPGATLDSDITWLIVSSGRRADIDPRARAGWRRVFAAPDGWEVLRARGA
jgi:hypothetical protein